MDTFVRKGHEGVRYFVGPEVSQTTAFGKKTLFIVGLQDTVAVEKLARDNKCPHISLGANRSFSSITDSDGQYKVGDTLAYDWEVQIHKLLDRGFIVTLEYPAHKHVDMLKIIGPGIWQSRNFVPVLSVVIPKVNETSINLTVKIDDSNFNSTNPGVWHMNHSEVTDSNRFTSWDEYGDNQILTDEITATNTEATTRMHVAPVVVTNKEEVVEPIAYKEPVIKNDSDLGLDTKSTSLLKPEPNEEKETTEVQPITNTQEAATAYSETTESEEAPATTPAKKKSNKKVTA